MSFAPTCKHIPLSPLIICSVKQNNEPRNNRGGLLDQRLEKKMNVQLSVIHPAANQRIKLPVPPATFSNAASEPKLLFLSLVLPGRLPAVSLGEWAFTTRINQSRILLISSKVRISLPW